MQLLVKQEELQWLRDESGFDFEENDEEVQEAQNDEFSLSDDREEPNNDEIEFDHEQYDSDNELAKSRTKSGSSLRLRPQG
jgi:hypothetical protein